MDGEKKKKALHPDGTHPDCDKDTLLNREIGQRLKYWRTRQCLTQSQVALMLNVNRTTYIYYEKGKTGLTSKDLIKIATLFHISADYLLGLKKEPET